MATETTTIRVVADTSQAERALGSLTNTLGNLVAIGGISAIGKQLIDLADTATTVSNKLKSVTNSSADATYAFAEVGRIAKLTGTEMGAVGDLFQKVTLAGRAMGLSVQDAAVVTENFTKALAVTGTTGPAAASAVYQFGQALGRGTVAFEDMKQLQESSAGTLELIAKQFGKTSAQFLKDVQAHKVGSQDLAAATKQLGDTINPTFGGMQKTVAQALQDVRTSFVLTMQKFEDSTGTFAKLAGGIEWVGNNLQIILPLIAAFIGAWAVGRILAIVGGLYEMVKVIRLVGTTAAVAQALATGGLSAIAAAVGATAAYVAADKIFTEMEDKLKFAKQMKDQLEKDPPPKPSGAKPLEYQGPAIDLKGLMEAAKTYTELSRLETGLIGLGKYRVEQEKAVLEFANKQNTTYDKIKNTAAANLVRQSVLEKTLAQEQAESKQKLLALDSAIFVNGQKDAGQRQVLNQLEQYRLSVHEKIYNKNKDEMEAKIKLGMQQQLINSYTVSAQEAQSQLNALGIADLNTREVALAVDKARRDNGVLFTAEAEKQLRASIAIAQQTRLQVELDKQRLALTGQAIPQTPDQKIAGATATALDYSPALKASQEYATKRAQLDYAIATASKDAMSQSNGTYQVLLQARAKLDRDYALTKQEIATKSKGEELDALARDLADQEEQIRQSLRNVEQMTYESDKRKQAMRDASRADEYARELESGKVQGQLRQFSATEAQDIAKKRLEFEKKTDTERTAWAIDQAAQMFNSLGTYNKDAFEAAKALNIANAIMNTYTAATGAIAALAPIPIVGPAMAMLAAGTIIAAGLAQVASIRSQTYSGRALGGPVMGGQPYMVGENGPELFTPATSGSITRNDQLGGSGGTTVNFNISTVDAAGFDRLLLGRRAMITGIIADAQLEKGRRG